MSTIEVLWKSTIQVLLLNQSSLILKEHFDFWQDGMSFRYMTLKRGERLLLNLYKVSQLVKKEFSEVKKENVLYSSKPFCVSNNLLV